MSPVLFWSIWSPVPWTLSDPDPLDRFSAPITSFLDSLVPEITGPKVTILKELSLSTQFWTSPERKPSHVTAFR